MTDGKIILTTVIENSELLFSLLNVRPNVSLSVYMKLTTEYIVILISIYHHNSSFPDFTYMA